MGNKRGRQGMSERKPSDSGIRRRAFLGGVVAGAASAGAGCATLADRGRTAGSVDTAALEARLAQLDAGLDELGSVQLVSELLQGSPDVPSFEAAPDTREHLAASDDLSRRFLRALLVTGVYNDLSEEER